MKQTLRTRLGLHGAVKVIQAFLIAAVVTVVAHFWYDKQPGIVLNALIIAFEGLRLSYKHTITRLWRLLVLCAVGSVLAFFAVLLLPTGSNQLWAYLLAAAVSLVVTGLVNEGRMNIFPLVMVTITYFAAAVHPDVPRLTMALYTVPLFVSSALAAIPAVAVAMLTHLLPGEHIARRVKGDPDHRFRFRVRVMHPRTFFANIDPHFLMLFLTQVIVAVIYHLIAGHVTIHYPWIVFISASIVAQKSLADTVDKSRVRILGTLMGTAIGLIGLLLFGQMPYGWLALPFFIAIDMLVSYLAFETHLGATIVATFMMMAEPTPDLSFLYIGERIVQIVASIVVAVVVYAAVRTAIYAIRDRKHA
ncbi:MAG: FUSC family protein [Actinomycetes bacterium]|nr:FUSC family protein [Actinomycetes bacterium]